jgi:hypothetical protein
MRVSFGKLHLTWAKLCALVGGSNMSVTYEKDIVAWANEQAQFMRAGQYSLLDIEHIAEELETMGKSEKRALASSMIILLMHLLKWQYQPLHRGKSLLQSIRAQREEIRYDLNDIPSLKTLFKDQDWQSVVWRKTRLEASKETGLEFDLFPESCLWSSEEILAQDFFPEN